MPDSQTLSLIGAVTGIIGAVTGITGAVLGYISYRRSQQIKALDLRLELRKQLADVQTTINELPNLLEHARKSRDRVLAAMGTLLTGAHEQWKSAWAIDLATVQSLAQDLPPAGEDYANASHQELERRLVAVHALGLKAKRLREKYLAELANDDRDRDHIRADMRARVHRMDGGTIPPA